MTHKNIDNLHFNDFIKLNDVPGNENYYVTWLSKILDTKYYFDVLYIFDIEKVKAVFNKYSEKADEMDKEYIHFNSELVKAKIMRISFESLTNNYPMCKNTPWFQKRSYDVYLYNGGYAKFHTADETCRFLHDITDCIIGISIEDIQGHINRLTDIIRRNAEIIDDYNKILRETLNEFQYYE
jgi:hypothetical protein